MMRIITLINDINKSYKEYFEFKIVHVIQSKYILIHCNSI